MNCNNSKCKKEIRNYYTCSKCGKSFCTNHCMTEHTLEFHGSSIPASRGPPQRNSGSKSFFMKIGKYTKEIIDDPNYIYENFELVKGKNGKCLDPLGSGAFGEVFKAKHKKDGKVYAIKQIEKEKIKETDCSLEVIYREISIHRRLFHENIVKLYSHHEDEENIFLLMDYSNSGTLFNLIKKSKGLDEKRAFKFFIQTVAAVHFLHENYLIHRDLKPENLLVDENETVRLCDFGWCVDVSTGSRITFCGTYEYMAPELLKELPYDYSIDIWSLGILLYELLHGYSPFRAQNSEDYDEYSEIFKNIIKYNFKIEKDISKNCSDLLTKLLAPDTKARIRTKEIFRHPWVMEFEKEFKREKIEKMQKEEIEKKESISSTGKKIIEDLLKDESIEKEEPSKNKITEKLKIYEKAIEQVTQVSQQVPQGDKLDNITLSNINSVIYSNSISNPSNPLLKTSSKNDQPVVLNPQQINKESSLRKEPDQDNSFNLIQEEKQKNKKNESFSILDDDYTSFSQIAKENKKRKNSVKEENPCSNSQLLVNTSNKMSISTQDEKTSKEKKRTKQLSVSNIEGLLPNTSNNNVNHLYEDKNNNSAKPKKYSGMDQKLKEDLEEFSILSNPSDNLFDKVLSQVQNKNKDKKKKKQNSSMNKTFESEAINTSKLVNQSESQKINLTNDYNISKVIEEEINKLNFSAIQNLDKRNTEKSSPDMIFDEEYAKQKKKELAKYQLSQNLIQEEVINTSYKKNNDFNKIILEEDLHMPVSSVKKRDYDINYNNDSSCNEKKPSRYKKGREKDLNKELDMSFLPKELLYNDSSYQNSNKDLLHAIEVLENAQSQKEKTQELPDNKQKHTFWNKMGNFLNPFKCGKEN